MSRYIGTVAYDLESNILYVLVDIQDEWFIWDFGDKYTFRVSFNLTDNGKLMPIGVL